MKWAKRAGANSFEKCKAIITWGFIISEFIDFMISSKDISDSQILKCSLDIFCLLGIFRKNSIVAAVEVRLV